MYSQWLILQWHNEAYYDKKRFVLTFCLVCSMNLAIPTVGGLRLAETCKPLITLVSRARLTIHTHALSFYKYCLETLSTAAFWAASISLTTMAANPRSSSDGVSPRKSSQTCMFKAFAIFPRVSGKGHLLPRSISLKKGMEMFEFSAKSACDQSRCSRKDLIFRARIFLISVPSTFFSLLNGFNLSDRLTGSQTSVRLFEISLVENKAYVLSGFKKSQGVFK